MPLLISRASQVIKYPCPKIPLPEKEFQMIKETDSEDDVDDDDDDDDEEFEESSSEPDLDSE